MAKSCQILALFLLMLSSPLSAIELQFPVACRLMDNCWITNHVDLDRDKGHAEDYMCGSKTTDGSKSTHISLGSLSATKKNIPVIATADGQVTVARHNTEFCGTRVLIDHGGGWESNYCHLNSKTLHVREGQHVKQNQIVGSIGVSGQTDWPHLSYALLRNGMVFDPFSGRTNLEGCSRASQPLWLAKMNPLYEPAHVASIGFNFGFLDGNKIKAGTLKAATAMKHDTPQMSLWTLMMNIQKGDEIEIKIIEPSGRLLKKKIIKSKKNTKYYPVYLSTLRGNFLWDKGVYKGVITVTRNVNGNDIKTGKFTSVELR
jgi:hypothetical protein